MVGVINCKMQWDPLVSIPSHCILFYLSRCIAHGEKLKCIVSVRESSISAMSIK